MEITPTLLKLGLNRYPPYLGAGIKVTHISEDWRELRVSMSLRWFNRNAVGTHFGGSIYSMIDPHLMLLRIRLFPYHTPRYDFPSITFAIPLLADCAYSTTGNRGSESVPNAKILLQGIR